VVRSLAVGEAVRLARHPLVLVGAVLSAAFVVLAMRGQAPVLPRDAVRIAEAQHPLAAGVLLAAALMASRAHRHRTTDLFDAAPTLPARRTAAALVAVCGPVGVALASAAVEVAALVALGGVGELGGGAMLELLAGPAMVALAGVAGVALGLWAPIGMAPVVLVAAAAAVLALINAGPPLEGLNLVVTLPGLGMLPSTLLPRAPGLHLLYVIGLSVVVATVALVRHGRRLGLLLAGAAGLGVALAGGLAVTRPPASATLEPLVAALREPATAQACTEAEGLTLCAFPSMVGWTERWAPVVRATLDPLPEQVAAPDTVRQVASPDSLDTVVGRMRAEELLPAHVDLTVPGRTPPDIGGAVPAAMRWGRAGDLGDAQLMLALATAAEALDLPERWFPQARPAGPGTPEGTVVYGRCSQAGQAREVVALWLAGQSSTEARMALRDALDEQSFEAIAVADAQYVVSELDRLDMLTANPYAVADISLVLGWSRSGATLAAQLLDLPHDMVTARLRSGWARWTDPTTPADALVDEFALPGLPMAEERLAAAGITPLDPTYAEALVLLESSSEQWQPPCP